LAKLAWTATVAPPGRRCRGARLLAARANVPPDDGADVAGHHGARGSRPTAREHATSVDCAPLLPSEHGLPGWRTFPVQSAWGPTVRVRLGALVQVALQRVEQRAHIDLVRNVATAIGQMQDREAHRSPRPPRMQAPVTPDQSPVGLTLADERRCVVGRESAMSARFLWNKSSNSSTFTRGSRSRPPGDLDRFRGRVRLGWWSYSLRCPTTRRPCLTVDSDLRTRTALFQTETDHSSTIARRKRPPRSR
jgi:hypothetical protein